MMMVIRFRADICILSEKRRSLIIRIGAVVNRKLKQNTACSSSPPIEGRERPADHAPAQTYDRPAPGSRKIANSAI